jgi:hypothetical protein
MVLSFGFEWLMQFEQWVWIGGRCWVDPSSVSLLRRVEGCPVLRSTAAEGGPVLRSSTAEEEELRRLMRGDGGLRTSGALGGATGRPGRGVVAARENAAELVVRQSSTW